MVTKLKLLWECWKMVTRMPGAFKMTQIMLEFVTKVSNEEKPMMQKVGLFNVKDGTKFGDFISLWAGPGECDHFQRLEGVLNQRNELKKTLAEISLTGYMTPHTQQQIEFMLKHFV